MDGTSVVLRWDKTAILNFALGRLASLEFFIRSFPIVCAAVESKRDLISRGALGDDEAEEMLLNVFPKSLDRNKLKTTTFFSTYFSDAGSDNDSKASFYPRLFDAFLRGLSELATKEDARFSLKDGRLSSPAVLRAYDEASGTFINEVRHELYTLLPLDEDASENKKTVDLLIESFSGQKTPFEPDELTIALTGLTGIDTDKVRDALHRMREMGIFETTPGGKGTWRTGRLYKSGLKMKYVRGASEKR